MKTPTMEECEEIILEYKMPEHIRKHTETVRKISNYMAKKISEKKEVDSELVDKAALMHDFAKMHCVENNCGHAFEAEKILIKKGFPEFGKIIRQHALAEVNKFDENTSLEAKIVWYADKRVNHDKIVSMSERYEYLKDMYGTKSEEKMSEIISTEKNASKIEEELLGLASLEKEFMFEVTE